MEHGTELPELTQQIEQAALAGDALSIRRLERELAELREQTETQAFADRCAELQATMRELEEERDELRRQRLALEAAQAFAVDALNEVREREQAAVEQCRDLDASIYLASARLDTVEEQRRSARTELSKLIKSRVGG